MPPEFLCRTMRYDLRTRLERPLPGELRIGFENRAQIDRFFSEAQRDRSQVAHLEEIARRVMSPSVQCLDPISNLTREIECGNVSLVLKSIPYVSERPEESRASYMDPFSQFVRDAADRLGQTLEKIRISEFSILERTFEYTKDSPSTPMIIDTSSAMEHTTNWRSWDSPFEISLLGAFKGVVAFHAAHFVGLGNSSIAAAAFGARSELISMQYCVRGRSVIRRPWYGAYALRFNLKRRDWEIPWVRFDGCGTSERALVELTRQDRVMNMSRIIFTGEEQLVRPYMYMNDYLDEYKRGLILPERSSSETIR